MYTIELSAEELRLVDAVLRAYLADFGHDEAELLRELKGLIARLPQPAAREGTEGAHSAVTEL